MNIKTVKALAHIEFEMEINATASSEDIKTFLTDKIYCDGDSTIASILQKHHNSLKAEGKCLCEKTVIELLEDGPTTGIPYKTIWEYHQHGQHIYYSMADWHNDVFRGDTILGYQDWVEHNLATLLHEIPLEGVDAIEIAGCTDQDGIVEVCDENEGIADFFSVYTHKTNEGVECHCDFNTKGHAIDFAKALAARTGIPTYGNLCRIDEVPHAQ